MRCSTLFVVRVKLNGFMCVMKKWLLFAAGADAEVSGSIAVCAGSSGPGNMHLINGLYDCHRNRVPVLAIAAHIPSDEIGSEYFQATHPEYLFQECSDYCEVITTAKQMPRSLTMAIQTAVACSGVSVLYCREM